MAQSNGTITTRKNGNHVSFLAQKQYKNKRYSKSFPTKADAQEWLDDLSYLGATDSNGTPTRKAKAAQMIVDEIDLQRARNETPTLLDCIRLFGAESQTPATEKYVLQLNRFTELLSKPINEISRLDYELEIRRIKRERNLTPATANRYQAAFSSLFKFLAAHDDYLQYGLINPTKDTPRGKEGDGRMLFLDREQQAALLQACSQSEWSGLYVLVYLLLLTGARRNEIARLRWENVDLKTGVITLVKTKNGTDHAIRLPASAVKMLKEWKLSQPMSHWVIQHRNDPRRPMVNFDAYWQTAKRAAKMPDGLRVHDLRHSTASTMLADGYSLEDIKQTLNHKSVMMTNRYAHALNVKDTVASRDVDYLANAGGL